MPTIKEVADLAGVAVGTVSHVINGSVPVSEPLRRKVLAAIRELDYHPNQPLTDWTPTANNGQPGPVAVYARNQFVSDNLLKNIAGGTRPQAVNINLGYRIPGATKYWNNRFVDAVTNNKRLDDFYGRCDRIDQQVAEIRQILRDSGKTLESHGLRRFAIHRTRAGSLTPEADTLQYIALICWTSPRTMFS